jgi:hypothetical protein
VKHVINRVAYVSRPDKNTSIFEPLNKTKKRYMKKRILLSAIITGMAFMCIGTFGQEAKAPATGKNMNKLTHELKEARIDSAADYQKFRKEAELKIDENQVKIVDLKSWKANGSDELKAKYDKDLITLEHKNNMLKAKIKDSTSTKTSNWSSFKHDFSRDMDELSKAIKDMDTGRSK